MKSAMKYQQTTLKIWKLSLRCAFCLGFLANLRGGWSFYFLPPPPEVFIFIQTKTYKLEDLDLFRNETNVALKEMFYLFIFFKEEQWLKITCFGQFWFALLVI